MSKIKSIKMMGWQNVSLMGIITSLFLTASILFGRQVMQISGNSLNDDDMPVYGWVVCEDLGMGDVPGVPDPVQIFRLCNQPAWELLAYCLEPEIPPPPEGTICERIDANTFWCGDGYQQLRQFQILQTPTPVPPDTPTPTQTPTYTATYTSSPTSTVTLTNTPIPTATSTITPTTVITPTETPRPAMGGKGNVETGDVVRWVIGFFSIGLGLALALVEWKKRPGFRKN